VKVPGDIVSTPIALRSYTTMAIEAQKRRVLITGCSPGSIGEALAQEFLSRDGSTPILSPVTLCFG
jgi:FlaA1/EpsC-like NDP-sugar epimerase